MEKKKINATFVNGSMDGVIKIMIKDWDSVAFKIPRIDIPYYNKDILNQPGVYFLFSQNEENKKEVFVGASENILDTLRDKLKQFIKDDTDNFYWSSSVIFTGENLDKKLIHYLQGRLTGLVYNRSDCNILSDSSYYGDALDLEDVEKMNEYIRNIKLVLDMLGYKIIDKIPEEKQIKEIIGNKQVMQIMHSSASEQI